MRNKEIIVGIISLFHYKLLCFCIIVFLASHMLVIYITGWSMFPKLTDCRVTGKSVYVWNARRMEYHVMLNDKDTNIYVADGRAYRVSMSGFVHKSCNTTPVVNIKISVNEDGKSINIGLKDLMPKEAVNLLILSPKEKEGPPRKLQI